MGAWGERAFDNDTAGDWSDGLEEVDDLSYVEAAFDEVESAADDYLEADEASAALAACEVLARLLGHPGYHDSYTESVDRWVAAHPLKPPPDLLQRASSVIDRILGEQSELRELWETGNRDDEWHSKWRKSVKDLRRRLLP